MNDIYVAERICFNKGFPDASPKGIQPYHYSQTLIVVQNPDGNAERILTYDAVPLSVMQELKRLQTDGHRIISGLPSSLPRSAKIEEDFEVHGRVMPDSPEALRLSDFGINLIFEKGEVA